MTEKFKIFEEQKNKIINYEDKITTLSLEIARLN